MAHDADPPRAIAWARPGAGARPRPAGAGWAVASPHDQHACLALPADAELAPGDLV